MQGGSFEFTAERVVTSDNSRLGSTGISNAVQERGGPVDDGAEKLFWKLKFERRDI